MSGGPGRTCGIVAPDAGAAGVPCRRTVLGVCKMMNEEKPSEDTEHVPAEESGPVDRETILELNFVPAWARQPPRARRHEDTGPAEKHRPRERRRADRPPRRAQGGRRQDDRRPGGPPRRPRRETRHPAPSRPRVDVRVRLLPAQKEISAIVRRIVGTKRAYPLRDIAMLFLDNPDACDVKIAIAESEEEKRLFQCRLCRFASLAQETAIGHLLGEHFEKFYTAEEVAVDPPSGEFVCVARCGLSGVLLGPPNHHSYAERVQEVHRARFPNMPFEEYQRHIETVRDEALIEQWKTELTSRTLYCRRDGTEDEEPVSRAEAEDRVRREDVPTLIHAAHHATMPASVAQRIKEPDIADSLRLSLRRERTFPLSLSLALRAAFRHKGLHVFKTGRGVYFAAARRPAPLDPEHAVEPIREVLLLLTKHPGCSRKDVLEALRPGVDAKSEEAADLLAPLTWLVDKGHIIEFHDGTLAVPLGRRSERPAPKKED